MGIVSILPPHFSKIVSF